MTTSEISVHHVPDQRHPDIPAGSDVAVRTLDARQLRKLWHGTLIAVYGERLFDPIEIREIVSDGYTLTAAINTGGVLTDNRALADLIVIGIIVQSSRLTDLGREIIATA